MVFVKLCIICLHIKGEIASPLSHTKNVTMVLVGKGDVGAVKLTGEILEVMGRMPSVVEVITGVNISRVCIF